MYGGHNCNGMKSGASLRMNLTVDYAWWVGALFCWKTFTSATASSQIARTERVARHVSMRCLPSGQVPQTSVHCHCSLIRQLTVTMRDLLNVGHLQRRCLAAESGALVAMEAIQLVLDPCRTLKGNICNWTVIQIFMEHLFRWIHVKLSWSPVFISHCTSADSSHWPFHRGTTGCRKHSLQQLPRKMADICRDWLTDQTTDCCFVEIGSPGHPSPLHYTWK